MFTATLKNFFYKMTSEHIRNSGPYHNISCHVLNLLRLWGCCNKNQVIANKSFRPLVYIVIAECINASLDKIKHRPKLFCSVGELMFLVTTDSLMVVCV